MEAFGFDRQAGHALPAHTKSGTLLYEYTFAQVVYLALKAIDKFGRLFQALIFALGTRPT
jgi:hypothetical protein